MAAKVTVPYARVTKAEELKNFAQVIAGAFSNDALNRFIFLGRESRPDHPKLNDWEKRVQYWLPVVQSRFETGAILIQTSDWAAAALWYAALSIYSRCSLPLTWEIQAATWHSETEARGKRTRGLGRVQEESR